MSSQQTGSGLVPTEGIDDKSAADESEENDEIMKLSDAKRKDLFDLMDLKNALDK